MNITRRARIKMKRSIRKKMIQAAKGSIDHRVFGYSFIVTDPAPAAYVDERRKACAYVNFEKEEILATILTPGAQVHEEFSLGGCFNKDNLCALARLRWHPAMPIKDVLEGAAIFLDILERGGRP